MKLAVPSFDVVSELDRHELTNAVDQANREIDSRFDFRGSGAKVELSEWAVTLEAPSAFQVQQMLAIFTDKLARRGIDVRTDLGGLTLSDVPKVMVEHGNLRNARDARVLTSRVGQERIAAAVARAVERWHVAERR